MTKLDENEAVIEYYNELKNDGLDLFRSEFLGEFKIFTCETKDYRIIRILYYRFPLAIIENQTIYIIAELFSDHITKPMYQQIEYFIDIFKPFVRFEYRR